MSKPTKTYSIYPTNPRMGPPEDAPVKGYRDGGYVPEEDEQQRINGRLLTSDGGQAADANVSNGSTPPAITTDVEDKRMKFKLKYGKVF